MDTKRPPLESFMRQPISPQQEEIASTIEAPAPDVAPEPIQRPPLESFNAAPVEPQQPIQEVAQPIERPPIEAFVAQPTQPDTTALSYYADQLNPAAPQIEPVEITQTFNQPSQYDVFSGGVNTGVDYATAPGTPVVLPQGEWTVEEAFDQARPDGGFIGNGVNQGYGNSIVVVNNQTGEKLRLSHLSSVEVQPGQTIQGGRIGATGASGNVTGSHLDAEYYNSNGQLADILQSPYGNIIPHN